VRYSSPKHVRKSSLTTVSSCLAPMRYACNLGVSIFRPKIVNFVKMTLFAKKPGCGKVTCFCATDNEFPQEFRTVRFNLKPKRCKSVSLSAKRSVSTLVGLAHGVVTEKLRFPYQFFFIRKTPFQSYTSLKSYRTFS